MPFILQHQSNDNIFLHFNGDEDFNGVRTPHKSKATRFPTEAAAIVTLEDSDECGEFFPTYVK